jgi:hypothetical protein
MGQGLPPSSCDWPTDTNPLIWMAYTENRELSKCVKLEELTYPGTRSRRYYEKGRNDGSVADRAKVRLRIGWRVTGEHVHRDQPALVREPCVFAGHERRSADARPERRLQSRKREGGQRLPVRNARLAPLPR